MRLSPAYSSCILLRWPSSHLAPAAQQNVVHIVILGTTDLHGNIFPIDYYTDKPDNRGLAKVATLIKQVRKENQNVLLIDSGDTIQGTPLAYYHNKKNNQPPDPMMLAMSALQYDAMAVGNHEYNFGLKVLEKARSEAKFPWLSANTYNKGTNETHYQPYIVKEIARRARRHSGTNHAGSSDLGKCCRTTPGWNFTSRCSKRKSGCRCCAEKNAPTLL